jgi:UDP-N-acetyl-2-amino-2-deoxyglucuronate dehydrogenase
MTIRYGLIGAAGYIAPRHLEAMRATAGDLVVAYDINDNVGVMDRHFPNANFFTEFEQFDSFLHTQRRIREGVDYMSICSPNYLHKSHVSFSLRAGAHVICEKPLVLYPEDLYELANLEKETDRKVSTILQLRLHSSIIALKNKIEKESRSEKYDVDLAYFTSRGAWYHQSWKGREDKSGGIGTNIGVHLFDMLSFVFGSVQTIALHHRSADAAAGYIELEKARVRWVLSINRDHLPQQTPDGQTTYRSITVDGEEIEFSAGFTELHNDSYKEVLKGNGFGLDVIRQSIELVTKIRTAPIELGVGEQHPNLKKVMST